MTKDAGVNMAVTAKMQTAIDVGKLFLARETTRRLNEKYKMDKKPSLSIKKLRMVDMLVEAAQYGRLSTTVEDLIYDRMNCLTKINFR